jgi:DNA-binding beta-propeller fold protein YncE
MRLRQLFTFLSCSLLLSCVRHEPASALFTPLPELEAPTLPGPKPDGSVLLPNQWSLRPAGKQIELRDFPLSMTVHPGGKYVAVLHCGYSAQQISIVDITTHKAISHANIDQAFYGIEFSKDGKHLYCSGAGAEVIHEFTFADGALRDHRQLRLRDASLRGYPGGLSVDEADSTIYAANVWGDRLSRFDLKTGAPLDIPMRTNTAPLLKIPPDPAPDEDIEAATKRAFVTLLQTDPEDTFPYACKLDEKRHRLYVSLWAQSAVAVVDTDANRVVAHWQTEEHPCEMTLTRSGKYLFVANANRNTVTVFDTDTGHAVETIWAALYPDAPPGSTPNSLTLSRDESLLFVANANVNALAVFDISVPGKSRSLGFIPTGWYPTSVRVSTDGKKLLVLNGKGVAPKPNPNGPQPGLNNNTNLTVEYIGRLFRGTLSVIDLPPRKKLEPILKDYTATVYNCSPLKAGCAISLPHPADNPIPAKPGDPTPIRYVIYIVKENRTYDQVLGDLPQGNGDPKLCLFPERVTPNEHKLAREFVLLDNFYADAEISADGHEWSMGAYASDFVEKMWPPTYGHNSPRKLPYPAEGNFTIAYPANGYLWDQAKSVGLSYRCYGEFIQLYRTSTGPFKTNVKNLKNHLDEWYPGFDLDIWDTNRAARFISELKGFEEQGEMPRLQVIRLGNDHTHGTTTGYRTPSAYVADNDFSFGQIMDALSHSRFWPRTAVFVVEDDAQNGPDHVDAHRTLAFALSPYIKRGSVDSTMYSTCSMLRTIELILGLPPMSQFDAAAKPMFNSFQPKPDLKPYVVEAPRIDLTEKNAEHAWGGKLKMNFAKEDAADDLLLNEAIWRSVRGADNKMPAPVRAGFVFPVAKADDD